jgi:hypothetical protein
MKWKRQMKTKSSWVMRSVTTITLLAFLNASLPSHLRRNGNRGIWPFGLGAVHQPSRVRREANIFRLILWPPFFSLATSWKTLIPLLHSTRKALSSPTIRLNSFWKRSKCVIGQSKVKLFHALSLLNSNYTYAIDANSTKPKTTLTIWKNDIQTRLLLANLTKSKNLFVFIRFSIQIDG